MCDLDHRGALIKIDSNNRTGDIPLAGASQDAGPPHAARQICALSVWLGGNGGIQWLSKSGGLLGRLPLSGQKSVQAARTVGLIVPDGVSLFRSEL